ncbi:MAG TPA: hypothetical protein VLA74_05590, partial [Nitrososphaeraceae archaeon]|nr:hypothetical protein [Nitrososphaeraceae archaeon]
MSGYANNKRLIQDKNQLTYNKDDSKSINQLPFSIVLPVKSEYQLLQNCLKSCYAVNPDEVI